ncbi:MAG: M23 family metallopeptidase [Prevotella sp.]|nr:M23 family metallopeptidase [Prevotella sp.]MBQ6186903.1 M23 family metallopeptidase [Prevotella sp.]
MIKKQNSILRTLIILVLLVVTLTAWAPVRNEFTPAEQQSISVETPGLFDKSKTIRIDMSLLRDDEYSFPLPVGKISQGKDNNVIITTSEGDAVKSMFDGCVRLSRKHPEFGNIIVVRHANGLETVYGNNAQNLVKVGDVVKAGQTIAIVGERDGKTYLEFAIMINGGRINPETVLEMNSHRLRPRTLVCTKVEHGIDIKLEGGNGKAAIAEREAALDPNPFAHGDLYKWDLRKMPEGSWDYPLHGCKVISPYGGKRHHGGVDLKTRPNDSIHVAFDGEVVRSGPFSGYGNCVIVKHANGLETLYSHQSKNLVKTGEKVRAGQVIGLTGRTGRATTEHLHLETKFNGRRFNPIILFDHANHSLQQVTLTFTRNGNVSSSK